MIALHPKIEEFSKLLAQVAIERDRLRSRHALYLGRGNLLVGLDMGFRLEVDARDLSDLSALQPTPRDLFALTWSIAILRELPQPTGILVGATCPLVALNCLVLRPEGTLHFIDPSPKSHAKLQKARQLNEGPLGRLAAHRLALGSAQARCTIALRSSPKVFNGIDGFGEGLKSQSRARIAAKRAPLDQILGNEELLKAHFALIATSRHLTTALRGLKTLWSLNPFSHVLLRMDPAHFHLSDWHQLQGELSATKRRVWQLPIPKLVHEVPQQPRTLWITPSGW